MNKFDSSLYFITDSTNYDEAEFLFRVEEALKGEDLSKGALYFVSEKYADPESLKWFQTKLTLLYSHGGHSFYGWCFNELK